MAKTKVDEMTTGFTVKGKAKKRPSATETKLRKVAKSGLNVVQNLGKGMAGTVMEELGKSRAKKGKFETFEETGFVKKPPKRYTPPKGR
jgi:hypothetical protein